MDTSNIKAKTRQQMAQEYDVNIRTFMNWLELENIEIPKGLLCPKKVKEIYQKLGLPNNTKGYKEIL